MKRCPITYEVINAQDNYSQRGLRLLSPQLKDLKPLEYSAEEQRREALARAGKTSIQGVQPKLCAKLRVRAAQFELVDRYGHYILKPQSIDYPELPENEAVTMSLAATIGIEVPIHGLIYSKDKSMTYFVKRFDRIAHSKKLAMEDFAQLMQLNRNTKYASSMEKVVKIIETFCTFPKIEVIKLFKLTLFNFLVGNEDMHLKNFSLITIGKKTTLSPAYDLLNSSIALPKYEEEVALPLRGKKKNLTKRDLLDYFAIEKMQLNEKIISDIVNTIKQTTPNWQKMIETSFLSKPMQDKYLQLLKARCKRLAF